MLLEREGSRCCGNSKQMCVEIADVPVRIEGAVDAEATVDAEMLSHAKQQL
jgi:hypothetical protein